MIQAKSVELFKAEQAAVALAGPQLAAAGTGAPKSQRFFHLDALRAALMFWGILVHASTVEKSKFFRACAELSGLVRMEAFFVISGFLAYMLLKKYGAKVTVKKRLLAIGLPFVTALLLLNPVTNYLVFCYHNPPVSFMDYLQGKGTHHGVGPMNWHLHLWFLLALFIYSILSPFIARAVDSFIDPEPKRRQNVRRHAREFSGLKFLMMGMTVCVLCIGSRVAFETIKPMLSGEMHFVVRSIGNFLPFYALGMVLFASPSLRAIFSKAHWIQVILSCGLLLGLRQWSGGDPNRIQEVLILAAQTYVAVCLSSLLFWIAEKCVRKESPVARMLSEAAYSVYLFHFVVLYLAAFALRPWIGDHLALLVVISAVTFVTTLCLHQFVIRKIPVLELLFNGKPPRRAK